MRTRLESIQNTSTIKILADFLTSIKSKNFSGFALPFKLPLDASKYTVVELEEFDPVVSGSVAQTGDEMWVLVMGGVLHDFPRKQLEGFMSYHKLDGADQLCMNQLVTFVMSIYDSTGKINRKEMGVFLDALRSLKGSYIDPSATPPSHDPEDWTEIPAKISDNFPKQCIAVVQGGSLLLRNNFTRGKELRKERINTPEYGVDFDDDNLVLVCRVKYGEKLRGTHQGHKETPVSCEEIWRSTAGRETRHLLFRICR